MTARSSTSSLRSDAMYSMSPPPSSGAIGLDARTVVNVRERQVIRFVFAGPRLLRYFEITKPRPHPGRATDMVLMHMGQHDLLQLGRTLGLHQPFFQQGIVDCQTNPGIE